MSLEPKKSFIHAACSRSDKADWVRAAIKENLKLSAWVVRSLNEAAARVLKGANDD